MSKKLENKLVYRKYFLKYVMFSTAYVFIWLGSDGQIDASTPTIFSIVDKALVAETDEGITIQTTKNERFSIECKQDLISIHAKDVSLGKIITEIEKTHSTKIFINEDLKEKTVRIDFTKLNILKALEVIKNAAGLGGYVLVHEPGPKTSKRKDRNVMKIMIVPQGTKESDVSILAEKSKGVKVSMHLGASTDSSLSKRLVKHPSPVNRVIVTEHRSVYESPLRQRNPELSSQQLVLNALDSNGKEVAQIIIDDPRLVRAQTVNPAGEITCEVLYQEGVDFSVVLPDEPDLTELKIYQPHWTGTTYKLELIGKALLP